jgi:DNA-binding IclR family transcriptional regulator
MLGRAVALYWLGFPSAEARFFRRNAACFPGIPSLESTLGARMIVAGGDIGSRAGRSAQTVRAVERAVAVMDALLSAAPSGLSVSELSRQLGLHKTTVVRLLRTLVNTRLARKNESTDRYAWEPMAWLAVLHSVRHLTSPIDRVQGVLAELTRTSGETSLLGHPDPSGRRMGITARALPDKVLRVDPGASLRPPMHCTAAGKAYLSQLPAGELEAYLDAGLPALTRHTITSADRLEEEMEKARTAGYATTSEECIEGTAGMGVPVLDETGRPVAALQLSFPCEKARPDNFERWAPLLASASQRLTDILYSEEDRQAEHHRGAPCRTPENGQEEREGREPRGPRSYRVV